MLKIMSKLKVKHYNEKHYASFEGDNGIDFSIVKDSPSGIQIWINKPFKEAKFIFEIKDNADALIFAELVKSSISRLVE